MKIRGIILCLYFIFSVSHSVAQDRETDSLKAMVAAAKEDTSKVNALNDLSKKYFGSDPEKAIKLATQAKDLAENLHFLKGIAFGYKHIGIGYYYQTKYIETLDNWHASLVAFDSIGDKAGVANILSNIGTLYFNQGSDVKALSNLLQSLRISEELADTFRIATACVNIGNVYGLKKETWDKALEYYLKGLPMTKPESKKSDDKNILGSITVGIGEIYLFKNNLDSALVYFQKSLKAYEGTEYVPYSLNAIGKVYTKKGFYDSALQNHKQAYTLSQKMNARFDMIQSLYGLANAYEKKGDFKSAIDSYKEGQPIAEDKNIKAQQELKNIYEGLANSYAKISDYTNAFQYQAKLTTIKDTLYDIETYKKIGSLQFEFDLYKKQGELNLKELDLKKQRMIRNIIIGGLSVVMLFLVVVFFQKRRITKEKKRSDELLLNILPEETAEELKATGTAKAKSFDLVSVLFTDFKNFTQASEKLSAAELVEEINHCYSEFDRIVTKYGIEKIKTIGDAYMCAGGLPVPNSTHPADVVKAGLEMQQFILKNKKEREVKGQPFFELRLGIHTGPVVAGIVGIKKFAYDIWGDTVNTASRMESSGEIGRVNISGSTFELIKGEFICIHRGRIQAKNKGEIDMYFVEGMKG